MRDALLIASADRAGDHIVVVGSLAVAVAVAALVFGVARLVKRRFGQTHAADGAEADREER